MTGTKPKEVWLFLFNDILICATTDTGLTITGSILSSWIYNAESSLSSFAMSMSHALATAASSSTTSSSGSKQQEMKGTNRLSIIENSFECLEWVELEEMTVFALEGERNVLKRDRSFQCTSPLASMELCAGELAVSPNMRYPKADDNILESRAEKDSWLMALNETKYTRMGDLQTLKQTATMRQAKRRSLQPSSRQSSSVFSNYSARSDSISEVEGDSYNPPVVSDTSRLSKYCTGCKRPFSLLVPSQACLLACGNLFCSNCTSQVSKAL